MTELQLQYREYQEKVRHNQATEEQARAELAEQQRHSYVSEGETFRSNVANEDIKRQQNMINAAHYQRMDQETQRHNKQNEKLEAYNTLLKARDTMINAGKLDVARQEADIKQQQVDVSKKQADTQYLNTVLDYLIDARKVTVDEKQLGINQGLLDVQKGRLAIDTGLNEQKIKESRAATFQQYSRGINYITKSGVDVKHIIMDAGPTKVTPSKVIKTIIPKVFTGATGQR